MDANGKSESRASGNLLPGPPKEPNTMAQYPKIESIGSIGSIILAIFRRSRYTIVCRVSILGIVKMVLGTYLLFGSDPSG